MLYSCFDDSAGEYKIYEDRSGRPVNADLPVPKLGADVAGIGVPSIHAGRPMPSNVRYVGRSPIAKGIVVRCGELGGLDETLKTAFERSILIVVLSGSALIGYFVSKAVLR